MSEDERAALGETHAVVQPGGQLARQLRASELYAVPHRVMVGRRPGVGLGPTTLTDAELDDLEARAHTNGLLPAEVTLAIVRDERARRARLVNLRHALAGHPLGRPR